MTDMETSIIDTPIEAQVIAPKSSNFRGRNGPSRAKAGKYQNFTILKTLSNQKFSVYLIESEGTKLAMKIFPEKDGQVQQNFNNEIRFTALNHENIVKNVYVEQGKQVMIGDKLTTVSLILSEFAPHGDFFEFVTSYTEQLSDKLIRSYFHQLINGIEYIHACQAAHLDLKLENLLMGEDFKLKIADFDLSYFAGDKRLYTKGTRFYRSPEIMEANCKNCPAADIYSAGVILFVMKSGGIIPHAEGTHYKGIDLYNLLHNDNKQFWNKHCDIQKRSQTYFSNEFKELFNGMTKMNPEERLSLSAIKASSWYNGPVYSNEELKKVVGSFMRC